ncbi:hypothetical protein F5884DRAFT_758077 [Xylogone sp. PMI_703]|nr:hypothetical protein F5884DRAFT_758077 [Xylogone sp. PMI_703]
MANFTSTNFTLPTPTPPAAAATPASSSSSSFYNLEVGQFAISVFSLVCLVVFVWLAKLCFPGLRPVAWVRRMMVLWGLMKRKDEMELEQQIAAEEGRRHNTSRWAWASSFAGANGTTTAAPASAPDAAAIASAVATAIAALPAPAAAATADAAATAATTAATVAAATTAAAVASAVAAALATAPPAPAPAPAPAPTTTPIDATSNTSASGAVDRFFRGLPTAAARPFRAAGHAVGRSARAGARVTADSARAAGRAVSRSARAGATSDFLRPTVDLGTSLETISSVSSVLCAVEWVGGLGRVFVNWGGFF